MRDRLKELSEIINLSFDILDLIVVRVALFLAGHARTALAREMTCSPDVPG